MAADQPSVFGRRWRAYAGIGWFYPRFRGGRRLKEGQVSGKAGGGTADRHPACVARPRIPSLKVAGREIPSARRGSLRHVVVRLPDGTPYAYGWIDETCRHVIELSGVARFRFRAGGEEIEAFPAPSVSPGRVADAYRNTALPLALQVSGVEALHGSAIERGDGVSAFCAMSGTGKTTVAQALSDRGHRLWADDVVAFEPSDDEVVTHPLPFRPNVRRETAAFLGFSGQSGASAPDLRTPGNSRPLTCVFLLERTQESRPDRKPVEVVRLPIAQALTQVLPHAFRFDLSERDIRERALRNYLSLVSRVPVFRADFAPGFEHLPVLLDAVEQIVEEHALGAA